MKTTLIAISLLSAVSLHAGSGASFLPGDTIMLKFSMKHDNLDGPYAVDRRGEIRLPFVGSIGVQGLDGDQLARAIEKKYLEAKIYSRLDVVVIRSDARFISIPNPDGPGTIRVPLSSPVEAAPHPGDFYTPGEKHRLPGIDPQAKSGN